MRFLLAAIVGWTVGYIMAELSAKLRGGYQPKLPPGHSAENPPNPPKGGSGVPPRRF